MIKWNETEYKSEEIKTRRKFVHNFILEEEKIIDIEKYDNGDMWQVYTITKHHIIWKYVFSFKYEYLTYYVNLMVEKD